MSRLHKSDMTTIDLYCKSEGLNTDYFLSSLKHKEKDGYLRRLKGMITKRK